MRAAWLVVLLCLLLAPLPGVAQEEPEPLLTDRKGDMDVVIAGVAAPDSGRFAHLDLISLAIEEDAEFVYLTVAVADAEPEPAPTAAERGQTYVQFEFGGEGYRVVHYENGWGRFFKLDATRGQWLPISIVTWDMDARTNSMGVALHRSDILDAMGASLNPQVQLTDIHAVSEAIFSSDCQIDVGAGAQSCPAAIRDRMPEPGKPGAEYRPIHGVQQSGHLRLESTTPVRASNGDDTTYVFEILLRNHAGIPDDVLLSLQGAPASWDVRIPASDVRIDANSTLRLPVLVSTPFAHQHGVFESFLVEAHSQRDPNAVGRIELGVRYVEIPQPAGHHNTLWLHSRAADSTNIFGPFSGQRDAAYFNALQEDANSDGVDVPAFSCGLETDAAPLVPDRGIYCWRIFLEPGLEMGLDFDINQTGILNFPVETTIPLPDAYMEGQLRYLKKNPGQPGRFIDPNDPSVQVLGNFAATDRTSLAASGSKEFALQFTPNPEADLVPFAPHGASLWLELQLNVGRPAYADDYTAPVVLAPGGLLQLPLFEYDDPVDDLFHTLTDVDVEMITAQEAFVNPGETVLFEMRIINSGVVNDRFALSVDGPNSEWARILGDSVIDVRAGGSRQIVLAVAAPLSAMDGEQADLIFEATSTKDPDARALVRLMAEVDTEVDHEDQTLLVDSTAEELTTRTVPTQFLLGLVAIAFVARRRLQ